MYILTTCNRFDYVYKRPVACAWCCHGNSRKTSLFRWWKRLLLKFSTGFSQLFDCSFGH
jgi:hypothetical protein